MTSAEKPEAPRVIKHQDDDGQEWFEIADARYLSLERGPEMGTTIVLKFDREGVHSQLRAQWGLDDDAIGAIIEAARRSGGLPLAAEPILR